MPFLEGHWQDLAHKHSRHPTGHDSQTSLWGKHYPSECTQRQGRPVREQRLSPALSGAGPQQAGKKARASQVSLPR